MTKKLKSEIEKLIQQQKSVYEKEIDAFEKIGYKFVNGEITSNEFKSHSGGMGVYAQKGGERFMLRLRVLSGVLNMDTFCLIYKFAIEHNLDSIHFTTREAIQLHNLTFPQVISIMRESLKNDLFTRGGGGNFPRNVSLSPLSGVEIDEAFDVTPYAVLVNKYFVSKMNSYKLPRKFKVAFSNSSKDTANASIADIGFLAVNVDGEKYFQVYIGGSLGNNSSISVPLDELIPAKDVLYHVDSAIKLVVEEGDFENKSKGRMRFILQRLGKDEFLNCYKRNLEKVKLTNQSEVQFEDFVLEMPKETDNQNVKLSNNLIKQKQNGLYTVIIHPKGGVLKIQDFNNIISFLNEKDNIELRLSMDENLYVRNLRLDAGKKLLELVSNFNQNTMLSKSVSCIGVPTCQIGIGESQKLLNNIIAHFEKNNFNYDILPAIHISGCLNSCSRHQTKILGFHCKKKEKNSGLETYTMHINGKIGNLVTKLATPYGDISSKAIPEFLYELACYLKDKNISFYDLIKDNNVIFNDHFKKYFLK